jgi:BirA family biotin operon repressor/biotin-[acetyl-CoA-carboxylase] ligase
LYKILANTLFFGKNVVYVPECHSTNSLLFDLAQKTSLPEGTLLITNSQTLGRGQRGNSWEAEPGMNLTFSLLLRPYFLRSQEQFYLTIAISLGIHDFLSSRLPGHLKIKWPNDLMVEEKKIAGILIENSLMGERIQQSVVGIGLNVNQNVFSHPSATSMVMETGMEHGLSIALNQLLEQLESRYLQLRSGNAVELKGEYLKNLFRIGETHEFVSSDERFTGRLKGIDAFGKLIVSVNQTERSFGLKEISFIK